MRSSIEQIDLLLGIAACQMSSMNSSQSQSQRDLFLRNLASVECQNLKKADSRNDGLTTSPVEQEHLLDTAESIKEEEDEDVVVLASQPKSGGDIVKLKERNKLGLIDKKKEEQLEQSKNDYNQGYMDKIEQTTFSTRRRMLHKDACVSHKHTNDVKNLYYKFRESAATSQPRRIDASIFADMMPNLAFSNVKLSQSQDGMMFDLKDKKFES